MKFLKFSDGTRLKLSAIPRGQKPDLIIGVKSIVSEVTAVVGFRSYTNDEDGHAVLLSLILQSS